MGDDRGRAQRLFFAVWPDAIAAARLEAVATVARSVCGGRAMARDSLHLTLAFLGEVSLEQAAAARVAADGLRQPGFELCLDRLGYWRHNHILWAGGDCPPLVTLAGRLQQALGRAGFQMEERPFATHLTLLRNARCASPPDLVEPVRWPVREFLLVASDSTSGRAAYRAVHRWALG